MLMNLKRLVTASDRQFHVGSVIVNCFFAHAIEPVKPDMKGNMSRRRKPKQAHGNSQLMKPESMPQTCSHQACSQPHHAFRVWQGAWCWISDSLI